MRISKFFFKIEIKSKGDVFWNGVFIQPVGENEINVKNEETDIIPNVQKYFNDTKLTTKSLNNIEKETVFDILILVGFYDRRNTKELNSARKKNTLYIPPKTTPKILNPPLTEIEKLEEFFEETSDNDLEGQGVETIILPSNTVYF